MAQSSGGGALPSLRRFLAPVTSRSCSRLDNCLDGLPLPGTEGGDRRKAVLHRAEKLHTPVLPLECGRARGIENRDFIREDKHPERCWVTIPAFNSLYPEIAEATDLASSLRSNMHESLPLENWAGTPLEALLRTAGIVLGIPQ